MLETNPCFLPRFLWRSWRNSWCCWFELCGPFAEVYWLIEFVFFGVIWTCSSGILGWPVGCEKSSSQTLLSDISPAWCNNETHVVFFCKTSLPYWCCCARLPMLGGKGWWWSFPMLATCFDPSEVDYSGQVCGYSPGVEDEGSKRAEGWVFNVTGLNHQSWNGCWRLGCMQSRYNIVSIKPSSMLYFCRNLIFLIEVALWLFWPRVWYTYFFFLSFSSVTQSDQMCLPEGQTLPLCLWQGECRISGVAHGGISPQWQEKPKILDDAWNLEELSLNHDHEK